MMLQTRIRCLFLMNYLNNLMKRLSYRHPRKDEKKSHLLIHHYIFLMG